MTKEEKDRLKQGKTGVKVCSLLTSLAQPQNNQSTHLTTKPMGPRQIPCSECRRQSVKCVWPPQTPLSPVNGNPLVCIRCSKKPSHNCSGPERKSPKPCLSCKKSRAKCVRKDDLADGDCERCLKRGTRCQKAMDQFSASSGSSGTGTGSSSGSGSGSSDGSMSPASEKLSESAMLHMLDVQLALEGEASLTLLDRSCVFLHRDGKPFNRRVRIGQGGAPIDNVLTLIFVLAGVRYTTAQDIVGSSVPSLVPSSTLFPSDSLPLISRRAKAVRDLSNRIINSLAAIPVSSIAACDVARYVGAIDTAGLLCVLDRDESETWRRLSAGGVEKGVIELCDEVEARNRGRDEEEVRLLLSAVAKLAFREGVGSAAVGLPSLISSTFFHLSCGSHLGPPAKVVLSPELLTPIFTPSPYSATLDPDLQYLLRQTLLDGSLKALVQLTREVTRDFRLEVSSRAREWWDKTEELSNDIAEILDSVLGDPRRYGGQSEERVWMIARSLCSTTEFVSELDLMICEAVLLGGVGSEVDLLKEQATLRLRAYVKKAARRSGVILSGAESGSPIQIYHPIYFISKNLAAAVRIDVNSFLTLSSLERDWILRGLKFATYWEAEAAVTGGAIEDCMSKLSLREDKRERNFHGDAVAQRMVEQALRSMLS